MWAFLMAENNKEAFYTSCQARNDLVNIWAQVVGLQQMQILFLPTDMQLLFALLLLL
jgi:hypothetical protein